MSNYKTQATADELVSALAVRTGLSASMALVSGIPTVTLGSVAVAGGGATIQVKDQRNEVNVGKALPGFDPGGTTTQPVYTTGYSKLIVESEGAPSVAYVAAALDVTFNAVIATDALIVGSTTYTCIAAAPAAANQFVVGASDDETADNFCIMFNQSQSAVHATHALGVITLTAVVPGAAGNLIHVSPLDATITTAGGSLFLTGGTGGSAVGWYEFTSVIATDAFAIAGTTFTCIAPGVPTAVQFVVGADDYATAVNAAAAINAHTTVGKLVTAVAVHGDTAATAWLYLTAKTPGPIGNLITTTTADATITVFGATLAGGAGGPNGFVMGTDRFLEIIGECAKRGLNLEVYATDKGVAPVAGAGTLVATFFANPYYTLNGTT